MGAIENIKELKDYIFGEKLTVRQKITKLLSDDLFTDNTAELCHLTKKTKDEVESCRIRYQELERLIVAKKMNGEDISAEKQEQEEMVEYLLGIDKEKEAAINM